MFDKFDPLAAKQATDTEVAMNAVKREIRNILESYFGWYDPFCELIQNSLDSLEERISNEDEDYEPQLRIRINLKEQTVSVADNGTGLDKEKYEKFLAPSFSFKKGNTRGHKGVGATYLAYGFNYIQIATKTDDFVAVGKMIDARKWLTDENPVSNPQVVPDKSKVHDPGFEKLDRGVCMTLRFDKTTRPGDLTWINATTANQWMKILSVKTGAGSIFRNKRIKVTVVAFDIIGKESKCEQSGVTYLWPHTIVGKSESLKEINNKIDKQIEKHGPQFKIPSSINKLDAIYDFLDVARLEELITLDESEQKVCKQFSPRVYFCYMYSAKVWSKFNEDVGIRQGQSILSPGIQIAANNMPQGEIVQIPLKRNIGRQNQIHIVVHLEECRSDLGRKGFQNEIIDFSQTVARKLMDGPIMRLKRYLRPVTGVMGDLHRENKVDEWKDEFRKHEEEYPLIINNDNFFLPTQRVSLTSIPTREQDVIALFNQLLAGGVIRGITIMATNESFTYDGMYRIIIDKPFDNHLYYEKTNPLGVLKENIDNQISDSASFTSHPKIMEYKFSLDALIEDIESGIKNSNDISLVIVWETGSDYEGNYQITSLLDKDNLSERQYHGITHVMTNTNTGQREMDLIVLQELIEFLNDPDETVRKQQLKYED